MPLKRRNTCLHHHYLAPLGDNCTLRVLRGCRALDAVHDAANRVSANRRTGRRIATTNHPATIAQNWTACRGMAPTATLREYLFSYDTAAAIHLAASAFRAVFPAALWH